MPSAEEIAHFKIFRVFAGVRRMPSWFSRRLAVGLCLACLCVTGCGQSSNLTGRWFNNDVSIRFRENGTALYNSKATGLVEGRYQYNPKPIAQSGMEPVKNLTVWLPQSGRTLVLNFQLSLLGSDRIQLKPISEAANRSRSRNPSPVVGVVLKRALNESQHSDGLDETPPLASATPELAK